LTIVEEVAPSEKAVAHRLPRVVAQLEPQRRQFDGASLEFGNQQFFAVLVPLKIARSRRQVFLSALGRQDKFSVESEIRPFAFGGDCPHHGKFLPAVRTIGDPASARAGLRIEGRQTAWALLLNASVAAGKDVAAFRAKELHLGLLPRIRVPADDPRWKEVYRLRAMRTVRPHDPKMVQHVTRPPFGIERAVQFADAISNGLVQRGVSLAQSTAVERAKGHADGIGRHRVDVPPHGGKPQLVGFANRRARTHEGVKDPEAGEVLSSVEFRGEVRIGFQGAAEDHPAKDRSQPLRPPLVDVVDRSMHLFPPTLAFGEPREKLERE